VAVVEREAVGRHPRCRVAVAAGATGREWGERRRKSCGGKARSAEALKEAGCRLWSLGEVVGSGNSGIQRAVQLF